jgi:hypothetical protein
MPPRILLPAALVAWSLAWFLAMARHGGAAWHFFVQGGRALADFGAPGGGLHVYAAAPVLQIGPLAFLAVDTLTAVAGRPELLMAQLLGVATGGYVVWQAQRLGRRRALAAAVFFIPVWMYLAVASTHLDDVLALTFAVAAIAAARAGRPWWTGILLGLAVDAKPWALGFAALLLMLPGIRAVLRGAIGTAVAVVAGWVPFFLGDPNTVRLLHFTIANVPMSALRALGVTDPRTPGWDRPAQALLGIALGVVAVRRGRWPAVILLAVAARIALDPGANKYYAAGIAVGALVWDVAGSTWRWPWWTAGAMVTLYVSRWIPMPALAHGWLTLAYCLACATIPFLRGRRPRPARLNPDGSVDDPLTGGNRAGRPSSIPQMAGRGADNLGDSPSARRNTN